MLCFVDFACKHSLRSQILSLIFYVDNVGISTTNMARAACVSEHFHLASTTDRCMDVHQHHSALPTMWHNINKDEPAAVSAVTIIYSIEDGLVVMTKTR